MAMRRGGTGAWHGDKTQSPCQASARGANLWGRRWKHRFSPRTRVVTRTCPSAWPARQGDGSRVASSRMETPKRGTETCLNGRRELVTHCGTDPCPGRSPVSERGDRETCMVMTRTETRRVNEEVCLMENRQHYPSPTSASQSPSALGACVSSPAGGEVGRHASRPCLGHRGRRGLPLPLRERIRRPGEQSEPLAEVGEV